MSKQDFSFDLPVSDADKFLIPVKAFQLQLVKKACPALCDFLLPLWDEKTGNVVLIKVYSLLVSENILYAKLLQEKRELDAKKIDAVVSVAENLNMGVTDVIRIMSQIQLDNVSGFLEQIQAENGEATSQVLNHITATLSKLVASDNEMKVKEDQFLEQAVSVMMSRYGDWNQEWVKFLPVSFYEKVIEFYYGEQSGWNSDSKKQ